MDKIKCITFDPAAQEALPDHIKAKMKAAKIGCYFVSHGKEHDVWYSPKTGKYFRVWRHGSKEVKGGTLNSMMKDAGLK